MIEIKNVSKTFHLKSGDVQALKNVSLTIEDGEIYGIIGYSGAGKSTIVRCINLLETPDEGNINVNGVQLTRMQGNPAKLVRIKEKELRRVRKGIGMIFQHFNLLDRETVFGNIAYPLKHCGHSKEEIENRVNELLKLVGLEDKKDVYPSQLSGGQKQRVAIARALANNPKVLLSDEATSALDPEATESILHLLRKLNVQLGITIVLITHEMSVIKSCCHRVSVMEHGEVVETGSVYDIFANPQAPITKKFVESSSNLGKLQKLIRNDSELVRTKSGEKLVKLQFGKECVADSLLTRVCRDFNIDFSIVLANVEAIQQDALGTIVAKVSGKPEDVEKGLQTFIDNGVKVEVL